MDSGVNDDQKLIMDTSARFKSARCARSRRYRENTYREPRLLRRVLSPGRPSSAGSRCCVPEHLGGGSTSGERRDGRHSRRLPNEVVACGPGPFLAPMYAAYALGVAGSDAKKDNGLARADFWRRSRWPRRLR